jgi:hypothetical protein
MHRSGGQVVTLAVHRKNGLFTRTSNNEVAALAGLKYATVLLEPAFEFAARHN